MTMHGCYEEGICGLWYAHILICMEPTPQEGLAKVSSCRNGLHVGHAVSGITTHTWS